MMKDNDIKRQYIKPEVTAYVEICTFHMFAASLNIDSGSQGDHDEDFTNERRRTWGDLWD